MRRFFFAVFALLLCGSAFAFPPAQLLQYREGSSVLVGPDTHDRVCTGVANLTASRQTSPQCSYGTVFCTYTGTPVEPSSCSIVRQPGGTADIVHLEVLSSGCPAHSTSVNGNCVCDSGFVERGGRCDDPNAACSAKSGTSEIVNLTVAWQRTPSTAFGEEWLHYTNVLRKDGTGSVCNGGCMQNFDSNEACSECKAYVSQTPSPQGLYRFSIDMLGHYTGGSCTDGPTDQAAKADDSKDPPCPGFVGEVNGVKGCYGTADKPVRTEPPDPTVDRKSRDSGNPSAGTKPETGPGSGSGGAGRTPSAGSGGSQGGPASAAGKGSGDGTTDKPDDGKEQQNCGAPGQPPCKLDESGTPGTFAPNTGVKDYKDKMDQQREQIKGAGDGVFGGLNVFFSAPPVVGCSPFSLPNEMGAIDPCGVVDGVRAVMAYLWAIAALWLCLGWIREAV